MLGACYALPLLVANILSLLAVLAWQVVEPSARTVRFAMMEKGATTTKFDGLANDLTNSLSDFAWPIAA